MLFFFAACVQRAKGCRRPVACCGSLPRGHRRIASRTQAPSSSTVLVADCNGMNRMRG